MSLYDNKLYNEDVEFVSHLNLPWEKLENRKIMISGISGLIGSFFSDVIMKKNLEGLNCSIYGVGRNIERAKERFSPYWDSKNFCFMVHDINEPFQLDVDKMDYFVHMASNTHPVAYATDPIGTITANVLGIYNMLELSVLHGAERFVFASSNEIYGENRGDVELFDEHYCGYIDSNTMRAGYPESKRCGESLCQAYIKQKNVAAVIARFTRTYGPSMLMTDCKAVSQFIKNGINGEDIVLKSKGEQFYSYTYVSDAVSGLLFVLLKGRIGEAYNISDVDSDILMKDLASLIANYVGSKVKYEIPNDIEKSGYSKAVKARLCGDKLRQLGWLPRYDIKAGIERTIRILREL